MNAILIRLSLFTLLATYSSFIMNSAPKDLVTITTKNNSDTRLILFTNTASNKPPIPKLVDSSAEAIAHTENNIEETMENLEKHMNQEIQKLHFLITHYETQLKETDSFTNYQKKYRKRRVKKFQAILSECMEAFPSVKK